MKIHIEYFLNTLWLNTWYFWRRSTNLMWVRVGYMEIYGIPRISGLIHVELYELIYLKISWCYLFKLFVPNCLNLVILVFFENFLRNKWVGTVYLFLFPKSCEFLFIWYFFFPKNRKDSIMYNYFREFS